MKKPDSLFWGLCLIAVFLGVGIFFIFAPEVLPDDKGYSCVQQVKKNYRIAVMTSHGHKFYRVEKFGNMCQVPCDQPSFWFNLNDDVHGEGTADVRKYYHSRKEAQKAYDKFISARVFQCEEAMTRNGTWRPVKR
jgi:hypothetical protein